MTADRNVLFAVLCVQNGFVQQAALVEALRDWTLAKHRPLDELLVERGNLLSEDHALVAALVDRQLARHAGNPAESLATVSAVAAVKDAWLTIDDTDMQRTIFNTLAELSPAAIRLETGGPRFRIIKAHARGGLGEVFRAEDGEICRTVALKESRSDR